MLLCQTIYYDWNKRLTASRAVATFLVLSLWCFPLLTTTARPFDRVTAGVPGQDQDRSALFEAFGLSCAWTSSAFYILARFPQILANCRGKFEDDEDLNISMFLVSSIANTSYVLFMTLGPPDPALLAWIVTSIVTVALDVLIMCQVGMIRMRRTRKRTPTLSAKQPLPVPSTPPAASKPDDTAARPTTHVHHSAAELLASNIRTDNETTPVVVLHSSDITAEMASSARDPTEAHSRNVHQMPIWR